MCHTLHIRHSCPFVCKNDLTYNVQGYICLYIALCSLFELVKQYYYNHVCSELVHFQLSGVLKLDKCTVEFVCPLFMLTGYQQALAMAEI